MNLLGRGEEDARNIFSASRQGRQKHCWISTHKERREDRGERKEFTEKGPQSISSSAGRERSKK